MLKYFQCKYWSLTALRHKYPYIGPHTRCIMGYAQIVYCISHKVIKSSNLWIMLDLWPVKYPCAKMSPNLFLQKCKQQYLDKLKEVKTPWVLVGASNSGHSMIAYLLRQLTKSNILWFLLDLWPLKILAPTWIQLYFFRNASSSTKVY